MKPIVVFALAAVAPLGVATAAFADSHHNNGESDITAVSQPSPGAMGDHPMKVQMMQMHAGMMQGGADHGGAMMGSGPGMGMMGGGMASMMQDFDADADGSVSPEELRQGLLSQLEQYDADGDGTMALSEFQDLFLAMMRETMVDRFQDLDADGDGAITTEEMTAPADRMARSGMGMNGTMPMSGSMPGMGGSGSTQDN